MRLDAYDNLPAGMREYLSTYGWHFSKAMCEWAIKHMRDRNKGEVKPKDKSALETMLKAQNVDITRIQGYDAVYVEAMARSDYFGSSIVTEQQLMKFVGDYLNDPDGYEGIALTRFYADCVGKGEAIYWEDML